MRVAIQVVQVLAPIHWSFATIPEAKYINDYGTGVYTLMFQF